MTLHITLAMQRQGPMNSLAHEADSACTGCGLRG